MGKDPIHYIAKCNVMFLPACVQLFQRIPSKARRGEEGKGEVPLPKSDDNAAAAMAPTSND